jgi:hypothetical protein
MAIMGCVGMLSAGMLGGPGIGYKQDYFASNQLQDVAPATFQRVKAPNENAFLFFPPITGIDGSAAAMLGDNGEAIENERSIAGDDWDGKTFDELRKQFDWWQVNKEFAAEDASPVAEANLYGSRMALRVTALIPLTMAVLYLILLVGFKKTPNGHTESTSSDEKLGSDTADKSPTAAS